MEICYLNSHVKGFWVLGSSAMAWQIELICLHRELHALRTHWTLQGCTLTLQGFHTSSELAWDLLLCTARPILMDSCPGNPKEILGIQHLEMKLSAFKCQVSAKTMFSFLSSSCFILYSNVVNYKVPINFKYSFSETENLLFTHF